MNVGDLLHSSDGTPRAIEKIEKEPRQATVYNFEVADYHSYFVSNLGIWVHNCSVKGTNNLNKREKVTRNTKQITEHRRNISLDKLEYEKGKFLGNDYIEVSPGKWRNSDGSRQFRAKPNDIQGKHGNIGPYVHFEFLNKNFEVSKNVHIRLR
ncbi:polymorphic toxin-type HINT domain-containing protein [Pseudalkalibacillus sp. SCS-8]|uniref:polymorphic toxin-type HINT domain-containing protein n=1 Tax=Pseudalkalibacillus nanhaiensis TaxID=3115291 RepID=UPI0032DA46C5